MTQGDRHKLLIRVQEAAQAFLDPIEESFWEEHGISDDEAERGALAMMLHLGVITEDEKRVVERHWKALKAVETRRSRKAYRARRAAMSPEEREMDDLIRESLRQSSAMLSQQIINNLFQSSPVWSLARDAEGH